MTSSKTPAGLRSPEATTLLWDAIEALSEGIAVYNAEYRLVTHNQRYLEMFPQLQDLIRPGARWVDLLRAGAERGLYVKAEGRVESYIAERLENGIPFGQAVEIDLTGGATYEVRFNPTGLGGFVVTNSDITERCQAEAIARDREALLEKVLDTSPAAIVMGRLDGGKVIYRSKAAEAFFGETTDARTHYESEEDRDRYIEKLQTDGRIENYRLTGVKPDGKKFQVISSGCLVEYAGETHVISVFSDLTERLEKEDLIRLVLEACPTPVQMTRAETGEVLFSSPETDALFGPVKTSRSFYVEPAARARYLARLREEGVVREYKVELYNQRGARFWASVSARLIRFNGEDVIVSHTRDLTDQLKIESELSGQRELSYQNDKLSALSEVLAGVAHELNNPLSVVVGHSLMLREDVHDPDILRQVDKISDAAGRCASIVKAFLTMARQRPAQTEEADINEIARTAVDVVRYGDSGGDIDIKYDLMVDLPPCRADADQITQVLLNLVLNAEHAIRNSGKGDTIMVRTGCDTDTGKVFIAVEDNGPGIPVSHHSRIFEPFFTTKGVGQGTGIGLTQSHRIIRSHDGQIILDKNVEEGTRFIVELPVSATMAQAGSGVSPTTAHAARILIVDDEVDVAELNAEVLSRVGYAVDVANKARESLEKMRQTDYDLIISDLNMPDLDGRGLFEEIKSGIPSMAARTVFLTGDTMGKSSQGFLKEAGRPYLEKPASPDELREFVGGQLQQSERAQ